MVAAVDHSCAVGEAGLFQRRGDPPDIMVEPADQPVIGDKGAAAFVGIHKPRLGVHHRVLFFNPGMALVAG